MDYKFLIINELDKLNKLVGLLEGLVGLEQCLVGVIKKEFFTLT